MDARQAELSRSIDRAVLGRRIRNARLAKGMTQGQLGESAGITTAYISRIEGGDRRPEATRLEVMAGALGVSLDSLIAPEEPEQVDLEMRLQIEHAQIALSAGSIDEAVTAVEAALKSMDDSSSYDAVRWEAQLIRSLCHEALGQLDQAIVGLERIAEQPRADAAWVKVLIALSRCYRESGDSTRAIAVGENAMKTLEELGLSQLTEAIQLSLTVAAAYSAQGDIDHAARICLRAIEDAVTIGSPVAQASAYWNASIMESRRGQPGSAVKLAGKAVALFELADDRRNMGRLRTQLGLLQLDMDPPHLDEAIANLEQGRREMEWSSATPADRGANRLGAARALSAQGSHQEALLVLDDVLAIDPSAAPTLAAEARVAKGQLLAETGQMEEARSSFLEAVHIASSVGADRDAAQFWFDLAELLDQVGEHGESRDAYRRAAASVGLASRRTHQVR